MTDKAISPLRQRMIEDMTARHFAEPRVFVIGDDLDGNDRRRGELLAGTLELDAPSSIDPALIPGPGSRGDVRSAHFRLRKERLCDILDGRK